MTEPDVGDRLRAAQSLVQRVQQVIADARELIDSDFDQLVDATQADMVEADDLAGSLHGLRARLDQDLGSLGRRLHEAAERRRGQLRFTERGVAFLLDALSDKSPPKGRRRWLAELAAALAAQRTDAVRMLLMHPVGHTAEVSAGFQAFGAEAWDGSAAAQLRLVDRVRDLLPEAVASAHAVRGSLVISAARAHLMTGDGGRARELLEAECAESSDPEVHAELAFLLVALAEYPAAQGAAARAAELGPSSPRAVLAQACAAEHLGDYDEADELYAQAVATLDLQHVEEPTTGSVLRPTGMLQLHLGQRLERTGLFRSAFGAFRSAVEAGVAGPGLYAEAVAHEALARLCSLVGESEEFLQDAGFEGGHRFIWRREYDRAVPLLRLAIDAGARLPLAGYYLAEALLLTSWGEGRPLPRASAVREANEVWSRWAQEIGAPPSTEAWVYATGARIAAWMTLVEDWDASWTWLQILRAEKGLALDPRQANAWGLSTGALRQLQFDALALEGAQLAADLDPDVAEPQHQLLALLANAGRFDEALPVMERLRGADDNHWLIAVRGWLRLHLGDAEGAVEDLTKALVGGFDSGWNLEVRAAAFTALSRFEEALQDLRLLVETDVGYGVVGAIRRARSLAVLGDLDAASAEIDLVDDGDPSLDDVEFAVAKIVVAACRGRHEEVGEELTRVRRVMVNERERDDAVQTWRDSAALLRFRGVAGGAPETLEDVAGQLARALPVPPRTADQELADGLAAHAEPHTVPGAALLAIRARRSAQAGAHVAAAADYTAMQGGPFDPEASTALIEQLTAGLTDALRTKDAPTAHELHRRLTELGRSPYASSELLDAELNRGGGIAGVRSALARAVAEAHDESSHFAANLQLGEAEVLSGDVAAGLDSLRNALQLAIASGDPYRSARVHARLGALLIARDEVGNGLAHLRGALAEFATAGLTNVSTALAIEVRRALAEMNLGSAAEKVADAQRAVTQEGSDEHSNEMRTEPERAAGAPR